MTLQGKIALITGSSRGIGWRTAQLFAAEGSTVVLCSHTDDVFEKARQLQTGADQVLAFRSDVSDPDSVKECYQEIFRRFQRLDILVNNAGILDGGLLGMVPPNVVMRSFEVNAIGAFYHLQEASRLMSRAKCGAIVNVTSILGIEGCEGQALYSASKAALVGLTKSAAKELACRGIRVNAVAPGFIETALVSKLPARVVEERLKNIRMGRPGQPDDVAQAILFLASDQSSYITGQVLGVDGGMIV